MKADGITLAYLVDYYDQRILRISETYRRRAEEAEDTAEARAYGLVADELRKVVEGCPDERVRRCG